MWGEIIHFIGAGLFIMGAIYLCRTGVFSPYCVMGLYVAVFLISVIGAVVFPILLDLYMIHVVIQNIHQEIIWNFWGIVYYGLNISVILCFIHLLWWLLSCIYVCYDVILLKKLQQVIFISIAYGCISLCVVCFSALIRCILIV